MYDESEVRMPESYEIYHYKILKIVGGCFFSCWWLLAVYMLIFSRKDGTAAYIMAYGLLILATWFVVRAADDVIFARFVVKKGTITRYSAFAKPKTYYIEDITKVVGRRVRGGDRFRIYVEGKKAFELNSLMWNYNLLIETLQKKGIPFR